MSITSKLQNNKQLKKIGKYLLIVVIISVFIWGIIGLCSWYYYDHYLPTHYVRLYEEGLNNVEKADSIALKLYNEAPLLNEEKAIDVLTQSAEKGNTHSQVLLGRYYKGYDFDESSSGWYFSDARDAEKSAYWYLQAAKGGNAEAQGELGHNYKYGIGVEQDFHKCIHWLELGAENGDAKSQWRLGNLYANGLAYYHHFFTDYQYWWYNGGNTFLAKGKYDVILATEYVSAMKESEPTEVYLEPNIQKAKYYWNMAAKQGLKEAKDCLEKIYKGDDD